MAVHRLKGVPSGSFASAKGDYLVSTPEFCFLQAAESLSVPSLVQLGCELCGLYSLIENASDKDGELHETSTDYVRKDNPLTTTSSLKRFLDKAVNQRYRRKATRALRYVIDGSYSPMETILALMLSLPQVLGGYGLPAPILNHEIRSSGSARSSGGRRKSICDLYWPDKKLDVEYDSNTYHTGADRIASDSARRNWLMDLGVDVITVTTRQLFDEGEFDVVAHQIARKLKKRLRLEQPRFAEAHRSLRYDLFAGSGLEYWSQPM